MEKETNPMDKNDFQKQDGYLPQMDLQDMCMEWEDAEEYENRVDIKMLLNNKITGFLPLKIQYIDNRCIYSYSIKGLVSLERLLENEKVDFTLAEIIFDNLLTILKEGQKHFLEEDHFVLEPSYMFWNGRKRHLLICYFPGYSKPLDDQMVLLSQFLLKRMEHGDKKCVSFVYGIYDLIEREGFIDTDIAGYLRKFREQGEAAPQKEETGRKDAGKQKVQEELLKKGRQQNIPKNRMALHIISKKEGLPEWVQINQDSFTVGRGTGNDFKIPAAHISCFHARIDKKKSQFYVTDLESTNGTYINGKKLIGNHPVLCRENDMISFADFACCLERQQA